MDMEQHIETCVVDLAEITEPNCPAMAPRWADMTDEDSEIDSAVLPPAAQEQDQWDGASSAPSVPPSWADSSDSTHIAGSEPDGSDWLPPSPAQDQQPPPTFFTPPAAATDAAPVWPSHSPGAASVTAAAGSQQPCPVPVTSFWAQAFVSYYSPPIVVLTFVPGFVQHDEWQQQQQQQQQQQEYQMQVQQAMQMQQQQHQHQHSQAQQLTAQQLQAHQLQQAQLMQAMQIQQAQQQAAATAAMYGHTGSPAHQQQVGGDPLTEFCRANGVEASVEQVLRSAAPELQARVMQEGPLLGGNASEALIGRVKRLMGQAG